MTPPGKRSRVLTLLALCVLTFALVLIWYRQPGAPSSVTPVPVEPTSHDRAIDPTMSPPLPARLAAHTTPGSVAPLTTVEAPAAPAPLFDWDKQGGADAEGSPARLHQRLLRETRDDAWAPYVERQISDYVAAQPAGIFSHLTIQCRATLCELTMLGDLNAMGGSTKDWDELLASMQRDGVTMNLESPSTGVSMNQRHPERTALFIFYERRGVQPEP